MCSVAALPPIHSLHPGRPTAKVEVDTLVVSTSTMPLCVLGSGSLLMHWVGVYSG